jgi:hypothetical protein
MIREIIESFNKSEEFAFKGLEWKAEFTPRLSKFILFLKNTDDEWVAYYTANKSVSSKSDAIKMAKEVIAQDTNNSYKRIARMWNVG